MNKKIKDELLCNVQELEQNWNKTSSSTNNNVQRRYIKNPEKHKQLKIMDMGVFCLLNDITPDMLKMAVRHIKETASLLTDEVTSTHNKVVIMSEEDYEEYEKFKQFQAFNKAKK